MIAKRLKIPDVLAQERSGVRRSGRHLSDVIAHLLKTIDPSTYGREGPVSPEVVRLWSTGWAWEETIANTLSAMYPAPDQGQAQHRIKVDGIHMTPDWILPSRRRVREFKYTRIHARNPIDSPRFWHYRVQLQSYLYGMTRVRRELWNVGELWVYFACGYGAGGVEKPRAWKLTYTPQELAANWRMILNASREMDEEEEVA